MPRVCFQRVDLEVDVPVGTSILEAARKVGAPQGSRCRGVQACSKCHVHVELGSELLSAAHEDERELIELSAWEPRPNSRLGCQARLLAEGRVVVRISDESFEQYLDDRPADREAALELWMRCDQFELPVHEQTTHEQAGARPAWAGSGTRGPHA